MKSPKQLLGSLNPTFLTAVASDALRRLNKQYSNIKHLEAAIDWLKRAQDESGCEGCSAKYDLAGGWNLAYPETTGYIISTFLRYAEFSGDESFVDRARKMGDWETHIQLSTGAVRGGFVNSDYPIVFNTGMVILGWTDLYKCTCEDRYLQASVKAADWLCSVIDDQGRWIKYEFQELPHAYCSRVAWSLLEVYKLTGNSKYRETAEKNIKWVLTRVNENGWIQNMSFYGESEEPLTHTIAYTIRGMLECSKFFDDELKHQTRKVVINAAEKIMHTYRSLGSFPNNHLHLLPGRLNSNWMQASYSSCLTGNAQIAIIWMKIYLLTKEHRFLNAALEIVNEQKKVHNIHHPNPGIKGGIAGSYPIWGDYCHFSYLNWAVKFYADSLMLAEIITNKHSEHYGQAEFKTVTEEPKFDLYLA